jgi:hypothetical protein
METLIRDIRYAARLLRCSPLFTFTAALSIAAGVGVDTTVGRPVSIPPRRFDRYFES